ncbi:uncharacterized protein LOC103486820 isoform X2 [Cucumis melo]|uniref:Uncharacterized protein LOC103486820 isoform X2 n=1 Tax=Cucumis melo TaxID=3656 RepID=A0ABM3KQF2_CUCME|nr:uncharacterized protein LOC103486820 isoform X2 [Cucumis melo]
MESGKRDEERLKILCLHGFRTNGSFLRKQLSKWDPSIFALFHMEFPDGIFPAGGKSEIEGYFPPPYFEWFQFNEDFTEYKNLEECIDYGAVLSALLLGYQAQGKVLREHPPIKMFVSISGTKFKDESICEVAYKHKIKVKSVHFIGEKDWLKLPSQQLASVFHQPLIIRHPQGHTVPRLDESATKELQCWVDTILSSRGHDGDSEVKESVIDKVDERIENQIMKEENKCIDAV